MLSLAALALTVAACACFYLASPQQRWRARPLPARPSVLAGLALLAAGVGLWAAALQPLAGFLVALHVVMACLSALPYLAALRAARRRP